MMKNLILLSLLTSALLGCSSMPSNHEMSCKDLLKKEKSLQSDYKTDTAGSILSSMVNLFEDTNESKADENSAEIELNNTKSELRSVQSVIHKKKCK